MTRIELLDRQTINSIAAGEVVERPASVVKELIDNALDAGADTIRIAIEQGGIALVQVSDNGRGMDREDAKLATLSHATSKLRHITDLDRLTSLGFRGEALASIAAVSRFSLVTRELGAEEGTRVDVEGGEITFAGPAGAAEGTTVTVRQLFYNTPARYKFLKSDAAEAAQITERVGHLALTRPDVSFQLVRDGKTVLHTPGNSALHSAIFAVFGAELAQRMRELKLDRPPLHIGGYMTEPDTSRNTRNRQVTIVNGRVVRSRILSAAIDEAAREYFMKGRHPAVVLTIDLPAEHVDVNVHPQKSEVRFVDERAVFSAVYRALRGLLEGRSAEDAALSLTATTAVEKVQAPALATEKGERPAAIQEPEEARSPDLQPQPPTKLAGGEKQVEEAGEPPGQLNFVAEGPPLQLQDQGGDRQTYSVKGTEGETNGLLGARLIGSYLNTYLLFEKEDALHLLDQHAAHERILYERLKAWAQEAKPGLQPLLVPLKVDLAADEEATLADHAQEIRRRGFDVEPFGPGTAVVRGVPDAASLGDPATLLRLLLAVLREYGEDADWADELASRACKKAVRAKDRLSPEAVQDLLVQLTRTENPGHCPHGRPTVIRLTRNEIERRFGRLS